jgi:hypothetical protein
VAVEVAGNHESIPAIITGAGNNDKVLLLRIVVENALSGATPSIFHQEDAQVAVLNLHDFIGSAHLS